MEPATKTLDRTGRALRSTVVVSIVGYAAQGVSLAAIPLFLKTVGAEGYGLMVTVMAFMGYLNFADAGLSWGSMILIAQAQGRDDRAGIAHIVRHSAVLAAGSGVIVLFVLGVILAAAAVGWRLPMFAGHPEADRLLLIAGVQLTLNLQFGIVYNLFQGLQEAYWAGVYQGCGRLLGLVAAMIAAWFTHDVALMLVAQLGSTLAAGIAASIHAWCHHAWAFRPGAWTDRTQFAAQLRIGAKNLLLQIGRTLGGTAPTLGISTVLGPAMVPFYTVPTTLLSIFLTPINSWNSNMQSAYGEAAEAGALDWVRSNFRLSLERALILGGLGVALFLALGDPFVRLWTHDRLSVAPAMAASVSAIGLTAAFLAAGQFLLTGLNRHRRAAAAEVANGIVALVAVFLAVRWLGAGAVGLGMVGAAALTSGWVLRREIATHLGTGCLPAAPLLAKVAAAVAVTAVAAALVERNLIVGLPLLRLVVAGGTGIAAFLLAALLLRLVETDQVFARARQLSRRCFAPVP